MIGLVKSPFHCVKEIHSGAIHPYLAKGETVLKQFKNLNMDCFLTNKRMIFTYTDRAKNRLVEEIEIEFVPYRSIERFTYIGSDKISTYNLEVTFCNSMVLVFSSYSKVDATALRNFFNEHI